MGKFKGLPGEHSSGRQNWFPHCRSPAWGMLFQLFLYAQFALAQTFEVLSCELMTAQSLQLFPMGDFKGLPRENCSMGCRTSPQHRILGRIRVWVCGRSVLPSTSFISVLGPKNKSNMKLKQIAFAHFSKRMTILLALLKFFSVIMDKSNTFHHSAISLRVCLYRAVDQ